MPVYTWFEAISGSSQIYARSRPFLHKFAFGLHPVCFHLTHQIWYTFCIQFTARKPPFWRKTGGKLAANLYQLDYGGRLVAIFGFWRRKNRFLRCRLVPSFGGFLPAEHFRIRVLEHGKVRSRPVRSTALDGNRWSGPKTRIRSVGSDRTGPRFWPVLSPCPPGIHATGYTMARSQNITGLLRANSPWNQNRAFLRSS